ncbi:MAG: DUF427 domain-containing protein [Gemmatimonadota bacterium]|nr:DUF427 domain-containing protein [Gemmatimonadota bacterium]
MATATLGCSTSVSVIGPPGGSSRAIVEASPLGPCYRLGAFTGTGFEGDAEYWTYQHGDESLVDLSWGYPTPIESSQGIAGLMAFDKRRVSIEVE